MAVGDIINSVAVGASFQPSAGTEIMVLSFINNGALGCGITDGITATTNYLAGWNAANNANRGGQMNQKVAITNSIYLYINNGFTGIQLK